MDLSSAIHNTHLEEAVAVRNILMLQLDDIQKGLLPVIDNEILLATCRVLFENAKEDIVLSLGGVERKAFKTFVSVVKLIISQIDRRKLDEMFFKRDPISKDDFEIDFMWLAHKINTDEELRF